MKVKTRLISAIIMAILGAIMACCSGVMAGGYPMGELPAIGSILVVLGVLLFIAGLGIIAVLLIFGGDYE